MILVTTFCKFRSIYSQAWVQRRPLGPQIVAIVDKWSLFRSHLCNNSSKLILNGCRYRQVVWYRWCNLTIIKDSSIKRKDEFCYILSNNISESNGGSRVGHLWDHEHRFQLVPEQPRRRRPIRWARCRRRTRRWPWIWRR